MHFYWYWLFRSVQTLRSNIRWWHEKKTMKCHLVLIAHWLGWSKHRWHFVISIRLPHCASSMKFKDHTRLTPQHIQFLQILFILNTTTIITLKGHHTSSRWDTRSCRQKHLGRHTLFLSVVSARLLLWKLQWQWIHIEQWCACPSFKENVTKKSVTAHLLFAQSVGISQKAAVRLFCACTTSK